MEETQLLRTIIFLLSLLLFSGPVSAQDGDAWLREALKLKQEGWGDRVSPVLGDMRRPATPLIAFVSFSMPEKSLKAILEQVDSVGGAVVLRGLVNNSFRDTAAVVAGLAGENGPGFGVDPRLFDKYGVTGVPVFVVPVGDGFDKIGGNMSLGATLEAMVNEGEHPEAARRLLEKLRGVSR